MASQLDAWVGQQLAALGSNDRHMVRFVVALAEGAGTPSALHDNLKSALPASAGLATFARALHARIPRKAAAAAPPAAAQRRPTQRDLLVQSQQYSLVLDDDGGGSAAGGGNAGARKNAKRARTSGRHDARKAK